MRLFGILSQEVNVKNVVNRFLRAIFVRKCSRCMSLDKIEEKKNRIDYVSSIVRMMNKNRPICNPLAAFLDDFSLVVIVSCQ